jgi:hypothetical protein
VRGGVAARETRRHVPVWLQALLAVAATKLAAGGAGFLWGEPGTQSLASPQWVQFAQMGAFATAGVLLVAGGRRDARAVALGGHFILFASVFSDRLIARVTPAVTVEAAGWLAWLPALRPDAFAPTLLWLFARDFPHGATFGAARRVPAVVVPLAAGVGVLFAATTLASAAARSAGRALPEFVALGDRFAPAGRYWEGLVLLTLAALPFIVWKARRAPVDERRRLRLFVAGLVVGGAPMLVDVLAEAFVPPFARWMSQPDRRWVGALVVYPLLLTVPFATAYAVLVDQALDVRLVVRRALQYALVRYAALATFGVPFGVVLAYLYRHRASSVAEVARGGFPVLLLAAGAAWLGVRYGPRLFDAIDRRFFREQYDARRILSGIVERARRVSSVDALAALVTGEIDRALHVERVELFVADAAQRAFVACGGAVRPLAEDAALAVLLGGRPEPLVVDLAEGALRRLPEPEREWLADGAFRLLVPIAPGEGRLLGLLALGDKKSELPFSREDERLLAEVSASAALALENLQMRAVGAASPRPTPAPRAPRAARRADGEDAADECARCQALQPAGAGVCAACGGEVDRAPVPVVLAGKFRLERRIGGGGMGVVYRARDLALGRLVAIKTLPRISPEYARRLRREARALAAVAHPNLALIYGAEAWQGTPMLVLEYLEAGTLAERLRRGPLAPAEVVTLGAVMADVLAHVHAAGVLHRDVKPSNIGFTREAVPKLLDFGVATIVDESLRVGALRDATAAGAGAGEATTTTTWGVLPAATPSGPAQIVGTPLYLSPEALRGEPPEPAVDLWALALVLYEAVSGHHPFARPSLVETLDRIARGEVPDVQRFAPGCPPGLAALLADALAAERGRRPGSAREFGARLERLRAELARPGVR